MVSFITALTSAMKTDQEAPILNRTGSHAENMFGSVPIGTTSCSGPLVPGSGTSYGTHSIRLVE